MFLRTIFCAMFVTMAGVYLVSAQGLEGTDLSEKLSQSVAIILAGDGEGTVTGITSGIVIKSDGVILLPYHVVKDAKEVQVRLKSGEIFDDVVLLGVDERRDVAAIRIRTSDLAAPLRGSPQSMDKGAALLAVSNYPGRLWGINALKFVAAKLADEVQGAGEGFGVLQIEGELDSETDGAIVFAANGPVVGIVTRSRNAAVPIAGMLTGLGDSDRSKSFGSGRALKLPSNLEAFKAAKNAGTDPKSLLLISKTVYVDTNTTFFKEAQLINELNKRKEVKEWGWVLTTGSWETRNKADLIIELDHQILTFDFTFTLRHRKSSVLISAGKVVITGGSSGAGKMTDKIIKSVTEVLNPTPPKK